jgi:phytoene dehydrogenase-like protein
MERAYDCWKRGRWSDDPFIECVIPSAWDPTVAPPGLSLDVLLRAVLPADARRRRVDAGKARCLRRHGDRQDRALRAGLQGPGGARRDPHAHEIENEIGLTEGNIFQGELTIDQLLFNRPFPGYGQYRMPLKNMYMCGSSTHPGGGVSSACGANAAREILRDQEEEHGARG